MALEIRFLTFKNGEEELDTTVADDYYAGYPLEFTANGKVAVCKDKGATSFCGLARNDKSVDAANGKVTYVGKGSIVAIGASSVGGTDTPLLEAFSVIQPKDDLYIDAATGKLTRVAPASPFKAVAKVLKKDSATEKVIVEIQFVPTVG